MIRALLATATVAAIATFGHRLYRSDTLDDAIGRVGDKLGLRRAPAPEKALARVKASRPSPNGG